MAAIDYYNDASRAGEYQYISLEQVVNDYMMSRVDDDITAMVDRNKVIYHAKRGFRELYYDVLKEIKIVRQDLNPNSLTITVPPDYVNWVRVSWVDDLGRLRPMAENRGAMRLGDDYLQDHQYNLLYDSDGCVLLGSNHNPELDNPELNSSLNTLNYTSYEGYEVCAPEFIPNINMSEVYPNGFFKIFDGVMYFSSSVGGRHIVIEYISDGLFVGCENEEDSIKIHKFAESAIHDWIYYQLIKNRSKVAQGEKIRARKEYYNSERRASRRMNTIRKEDLLQSFKGDSKWIK